MKLRSSKKETLNFNYKTGIEKLELLEKLAVPLSIINKSKRIIFNTINKKMPSTIVHKYLWLLIPFGLLICVLGMIFIPNPFNFIFLVSVIIIWIVLFIYICCKNRRLNFLLE